jgi:hypothetical protein
MKEIDCLARLFKLTNCFADIIDFLLAEKVITDGQVSDLKLELNKPKALHALMKKAEKDEKLLLLSFDWILLPVERIRIRLITERNSKELTYQY